MHIIIFLLSDTETDLRISSQNATAYVHFFIQKKNTECKHTQLVRTVRDSVILYCKFWQQRDFICNYKKKMQTSCTTTFLEFLD